MRRIAYAAAACVLPLILLVTGCASPQPESQQRSQQIAEQFVRSESTFRFDGMPDTLKMTSTTSVAGGWAFAYEFDSRQAGYGNRTGQMLPQVITHHRAVVTVAGGAVTTGVMDGAWDMMQNRMMMQ